MKEKFEKEQKDNYIEDPMLDMPDMEDDEKFRQWLEETYIDEAELIEKSLLAGQEYEKNLDIAEELSVPREKFYQRLKEEGLYEDETEADDSASKKYDASILKTAGEKIISMEARTSKEAGGEEKATRDKIIDIETRSSKEDDISVRATEDFDSPVKTETVAVADMGVSSEKSSKNDRPVRKKRSYLRLGKVAGVAGVCLLCVFAASMTSEANRNHFIKRIRYLAGDDARVVVGNDVENEDIDTDEYEAIENIESRIDVEVPAFCYRPSGMTFLDYQISQETSTAKIEYVCNGNVLTLMIDKQNENTASNTKSTHGESKEKIIFNEEGEEITIKEIADDSEELSNFEARWTKDEVEYNFSGRIELVELKKILKEMRI
ncbi:DUF4367 domain-containing protein [Blautia sp.]|uniref:DUF4367 domain-containing protein n=1 Tax=Blautia sp. TaxID=1955243 RepID=UPI003AB41625